MTGERTTSNVEFDVEAAADESRIPERYREQQRESTGRAGKTSIYRKLRGDKKAIIGFTVVASFIVVAVFAPWIAPHEPTENFVQLQPPGAESTVQTANGETTTTHYLGTTDLGYDVLSQLIFGARVSLLVAAGTVLLSLTIGTAIGIAAGYYRGAVDNLLMRYVDLQWAFPEIVLAVIIIVFIGGRGVTNVIIAIGLAYIDDFARLIRGEVLSFRDEEFIKAAEVVGMPDTRIMFKEILPNAVAPLIVQVTIMIPLAILAEAALSFIGIGVSPDTPTWGLMIHTGHQFLSQGPWVTLAPGFAIMFTVIGFNLLGDALRDAFDIKEEEASFR
jgi:ABC-type dipeptide/oligopeptide/nickel transport system permease subunit